MNIKFERVVCINLEKRPEKWEQFRSGYPTELLGEVERYAAIDGHNVQRPAWWKGGGGAWGCFCSHRRIIEECLNIGIDSVLIFEDDAEFLPGFVTGYNAFMEHLPNDAQWLYLGGQHLKRDIRIPQKVNDYVYRPYNINRTHAYGIIGRDAMTVILQHLNKKIWTTAHHIDHHFGRLHESGALKVYCPAHWLVDQRGGVSDVAGREKKGVHWMDASTAPDVSTAPFFAVLGCHSSGSSALAGALVKMGVHLGNTLTGKWGVPPINGGEAIDLKNLMEAAYPVPATESIIPEPEIERRLARFCNRRRMEALTKQTVAGGKYPQLALAGDSLLKVLGDSIYIIDCFRPLEESVESLSRRFPKIDRSAIHTHQLAIRDNIERLKNSVPESHYYAVDYNAIIADPHAVLGGLYNYIVPFLPGGTRPPELAQRLVNTAAGYINPNLRHVDLSDTK